MPIRVTKAQKRATYKMAWKKKLPSQVGKMMSAMKKRNAPKRFIFNVGLIADRKMSWWKGFIAGKGGTSMSKKNFSRYSPKRRKPAGAWKKTKTGFAWG